jgi:hypothetical protein
VRSWGLMRSQTSEAGLKRTPNIAEHSDTELLCVRSKMQLHRGGVYCHGLVSKCVRRGRSKRTYLHIAATRFDVNPNTPSASLKVD